MNIPNSLSLARICLIPLFVAAFFLPYAWGVWTALAIFVVCCFTDFLDGYIARKYNMITDLGKLLDPIADKILICAALFCVVAVNPLQYFNGALITMPNSLFAATLGSILLTVGSILILARELLVSAVRMIAASKGIVVQANIFGKIKTVMQDVCLPLLIVLCVQCYTWNANSYRPTGISVIYKLWDLVWIAAVVLFVLTIAMTIISGAIYIVQNKKVFIQDEAENK